MSRPVSLAVIVIARNEEQTIGACLSACLDSVRVAKEAGLLGPAEVVLVDSASTDRTREIAAQMAVRVIAIPVGCPVSAAAGRYVGMRSTSSEVVLFVDGDFVLEPRWLPVGIGEFENPGVAGVCGVDQESLLGTSAISRYVANLTERSVPAGDHADAEGIAVGLYRREWIERAGGIQPYLRGAEDRDLAIRVKAAGGRLVKTRAVMGVHHWAPGEDLNLTEYFRSVARWSFGEGQATRRAMREPDIRRVYLHRYFNLRHLVQLEMGLVAMTLAVAALAAAVRGDLALLGIVGGAALVPSILFVRRRREPVRAALFRLHQVPYAVVRLGAFLMGMTKRTRPPAEYPFPS